MSSRNQSTWDDQERGFPPLRNASISTIGGRSVQFREEDSLLESGDDGNNNNNNRIDEEEDHDDDWPQLRRRRSSITNRLTALTDLGGVNSIRSFTRSFQRAAGFAEVIPQRPSFLFAADQAPLGAPDAPPIWYGRSDVFASTAAHDQPPRTSLLRQHLEAGSSPPTPGANNANDGSAAGSPAAEQSETQALLLPPGPDLGRDGEHKSPAEELAAPGFYDASLTGRSASVFALPPQLATPPMIGSYTSYRGYGSVSSAVAGGRPSMAEAEAIWRQQQEAGLSVPDGELEPILVREVEEDGKIILTVAGQSTLPQTVFNSINVLIGVGLLSLPLGIKYAGWLCGITIMVCSVLVTAYTARLLARCMEHDLNAITFSDLAFISFGRRARLATSVLFTLELMAACVALIVLFADSLDLLFPDVLTLTGWKIVCSLVMIPLNFLPLRFLSFTSVIGILACFGMVTIVIIDGLLKRTTPGSLIEPATTYLFPANWSTLPLSFGLIMSPWGGHSVFPNIYRDMRHPQKYPRAIKITFSFAFLLDAVTAVAGLLMFGDAVMEEITSNLLTTSGYPRALTFLLCTCIAITPLTKIPLNARPIITTIEVLTGLHQPSLAAADGYSAGFRTAARIAIRVGTILSFLVISLVFPAFDSIMAFMGSALCYTICVTLPLAFYLKLFGDEISPRERLVAYFLMTVSAALSIVGTVWAFLPKSLIGAE